MEIPQLIAPTGILAFILFAVAFVNGFPRFRMLRYHAAAGYACCLVVIAHSAFAVYAHIIEPLGVLATSGMLLTTASGALRWRRTHIVLAVVTLVLSVLHVALILIMKS